LRRRKTEDRFAERHPPSLYELWRASKTGREEKKGMRDET
jgi:hypothetical protein